jgi:hypothetical protein
MAQATIRRRLTSVSLFKFQANSCGICGEQSGT